VLGAVVGFLPGLGSIEGAFGGNPFALVVGGLLAGGAVGSIVGSFAGLPSAAPDPAEATMPPDPLERTVLPFLIIPSIVFVMAAIIVTIGLILLSLEKSIAVWAAFGITVVLAGGAWLLARGESTPTTSGDAAPHRGH
jgi:hypothetical protein